MDYKNTPADLTINKTVRISASPAKVWHALTEPEIMKKWMAETDIDIVTEWKVGYPITIRGHWYETYLENNGTVLKFEPLRQLQYSHLSSLSELANKIENHSVIGFELTPTENQTILMLTVNNFPTETIYKHLALYWNVTLEILKDVAEQ